MRNDYRIELNFLPVEGSIPSFPVFRKIHADNEARPESDTASYSLPNDRGSEERSFFWVRLSPADGYEEFLVNPDDNNNLSKWAILHAVHRSVTDRLNADQYSVMSDNYNARRRQLEFPI